MDRHVLNGFGDKIAIQWVGNEESEKLTITYKKLYDEVNKFSHVLASLNINKGDTVSIYMPLIMESVIALLACSRVGAIHSFIFAGFSSEALKSRFEDANSKLIITTDGAYRGKKLVTHKEVIDDAVKGLSFVKNVIVVRHANINLKLNSIDLDWNTLMNAAPTTQFKPCIMNSEDPLFILYTSGSTGKPKGVLHTTGGYLVYAYTTFKYIFDYHEDDVYMCTADLGWITGHTYNLYGPLLNGATFILYEGIPNYPQPDRLWSIVEKYMVNIFYTAPTAIRSLAKEGNSWVTSHNLSSLRALGSVGEPIDRDAWNWYYTVVGKKRCSIMDTWWQTETGGILIAGLPGCTTMKPGSASLPFFGCMPVILDDSGKEQYGIASGYLAFKKPWPGIMRGLYKKPEKYFSTYFKRFPGYYFSGDSAKRDGDGYYWIIGRTDDIIKTSGHRLGTAEIESSISSHPSVAEVAVIGLPHPVKGEGICAFVILKKGFKGTEELSVQLNKHVRKEIGPIITLDKVAYVDELPKTRSGKIMRRVLRKLALGDTDIGDLSTLADSGFSAKSITNMKVA